MEKEQSRRARDALKQAENAVDVERCRSLRKTGARVFLPSSTPFDHLHLSPVDE
jgi:hypothetical protein